MHLHDLSEKLTTGIDEIRDRTADVVGGDGGSVFREFGRLSKQLTGVEKHLSTKLDEMQDEQTDLLEDLLDADNRTTWPRRLFWLLLGAAAGYGAAFLTDPDRGRDRRQHLGQELSSRADEVKGQVASQTEQLRDRASAQASQAVDAAAKKADELREQATKVAGQKTDELRGQAEQTLAKAQGAAREAVKDVMPDQATDDPRLLEDRIKSQVFGYRDDVQDVIIKVEGPGSVSLKGTVPTPQNERDLLAAVAEVDGVIDVRSELTVRSI